MKRRLLTILWPAFLMAGVLEMLVFAVIDPNDMTWFGIAPIDWPRQAIYTISFLIFWFVIATAGALTALLEANPEDINADRGRRWPR